MFLLLLLLQFLPHEHKKLNVDNKHSNFYEVFPNQGLKASLKTNVVYNNDPKNLYVTIIASDQNEFFSSAMGRDENLDQDDYIELIFDNYNQHNSAIVFQTNPIGTRKDYELSDNGNNRNDAWNAYWDVEVNRNKGSWEAKFIIPLSTLRFSGENDISINFKVNRYVKSINTKYTMPYSNDNMSDIEYNLNVVEKMNLKSVKPTMPIILKPYIVSNYNNNYELNDDESSFLHTESFQDRKNYSNSSNLDRFLSNIGLDLKYKFNPQSHIDLSLNTDFAQAESDEAIVNLSRYSLFRPEKREFFLENSELFNFDMFFGKRLFYSRKVGIEDGNSVPIIGGARFVSSNKSNEYAALTMLSNKFKEEPSILYSAIRYKQKLKEDDSFIGLMFTSKESDSTSLRSVGLDGKYRLTDDIFAQFYGTANKKIDGSIPYSFGLRFAKFPSKGQILNLMYKQQKNDFDPELGFIGRNNMKKMGMFNGYIFKNISELMTDFRLGHWMSADWDIDTNQRLTLRSNIWTRFTFNDGSDLMFLPIMYTEEYIDESWTFADDLEIPIGNFKNKGFWLEYNGSKSSNTSYNLGLSYSGFYGGEHIRVNPKVNYIASEQLNMQFNIDFNRFNFPRNYGRVQLNKVILNSKFNYSFSTKTSVKLLSQYDHEERQILSNLRFRYNPVEGTDLYIVYNQHYNSELNRFNLNRPRFQNHSVIIKFAKAFIY